MSAVAGPYWVRTATNGKHQVCGRNGVTIREYMPDQIAMADADCRKLQAGYTKAERALRDAAPELADALTKCLALIDDMSRFVGKMALQDYALFNEAPMAARSVLAKVQSK